MKQNWQRFNAFVTAKPKRPRFSAIAFILATELTVTGVVTMGIHAFAR
jgi:hypothetical protein